MYVNGLPQAHVPTFDGTPCEYDYFIKTSKQLVGDKPSLSGTYKYRQFWTCLRGEVLRTVINQRFETVGYEHVIKVLEERFGNLKEIVYFQIKKSEFD